MKKYPILADFEKYEKLKTPINRLLLPFMNMILESSYNNRKTAEGVKEEIVRIDGYLNEKIEIRIYQPEDIKEDLPCLIYMHGGAFVLKSAAFHKQLICEYVKTTPCKVIFVDYRLAPRHVFPVALEDCYKALEWTIENGMKYGIDINRIAVGGDSAGGALAAGVCQLARDRKGPQILFQMLIYPVIDSRLITDSMKNFVDTPLWNARQNKKMWKLYLGKKTGHPTLNVSPMEAESLENLPPAYVEVADFDCLRDEGIHYARALQEQGACVELNQTRGTIHGFEIAEDSDIVKKSIDRRVRLLKHFFYNSFKRTDFPVR
ncbi:alpha/beta hydrolase [Eubacteriaceae bacterium ES3]|nr:alpha/beta hydrolase [Eubacteriaceae bacterium ES3]